MEPNESGTTESGPVYKDNDGTVMYGFSSQNLERNTKWVKILVFTVGGGMLALLLYILWLTWYVIHHDVINNIVAACL